MNIINDNDKYNKNYILKNIGYFQNYIYKYSVYISNKNILDPFIIQNKICIIYLSFKNNIEENITGIEYILNYDYFLFLLDTKLKIKEKEYSEKELRSVSIIIKI